MNLAERLGYLFRAKWSFFKPRQTAVLIYDRCDSDIFSAHIDASNISILDVRAETINWYVLIKAVFVKYTKRTRMSFEALYKQVYIEMVNPKVVLTFIDNNLSFYRLSSDVSNFVKVFVQNGVRGIVQDVFCELEQAVSPGPYNVDYMLVFGSAIGDKYAQYIQGQVIPVGSFKNNLYRSKSNKEKPKLIGNSVVFISQFVPGVRIDDDAAHIPTGTNKIKSFASAPSLSWFLPCSPSFASQTFLNLNCLNAPKSETPSK